MKKFDISKYITNKELSISNDDLDIEKLTNDFRDGYVSNSEVEDRVSSAVEEANKTSKANYDNLQAKYDDIEKRNVDLTDNIRNTTLKLNMIENGFNKDQFDKVSQMRTAMYGDIKDDNEALGKIKEDYGATFFPKVEEPKVVKNDMPLHNEGTKPPVEPKVSRFTKISELMKK